MNKETLKYLKALGLDINMEELKQCLNKKPINGKGKCICFGRVSTEIQDLVQQTDELLNEAKRNGYTDDDIIIIEQKESAIKLDMSERVGINQLYDAIEKNKIDVVIIYEISRLARRPDVLFTVRDHLIKNGVNLICLKPYMRLLDNDGKMSQTASILFSLFGALSESEMIIKKERMSRGKRHKQALGGYIGGKPLFGYKFENDKLAIDYSKSEIVQKVYDMYEKGMSSRSIALELMETGEIKQSTLNNANKTIQTILTRPEYYGGKSDISKYQYPRIITKAQFERCRQIAKDRSKEHTRVKQTCLCKKLVYCKDNGYALTPNIAKGQYKLYTIDHAVNMTIKIDLLDKLIWDVVVDHSKKNNTEDEKMKQQIIQEANIALRKVQQSLRNIFDIKKQIDRIENRIIEGKMSEIKGDKMIEEKKIELELQQDIYDKNNYIYGIKNEMIQEQSYKQDLNKVIDIEEKQQIVRKYVDKILLQKSGIKRGHYIIEICMKTGIIYKYAYWSSGPWNNVELID